MPWGRPWSRIKPVWVMAGLSGGPAPALGLDRPDCIAAPGDLLCLGLRPLPARAPGVEAGVSIPGLAEEDTEKRGFWQLPGLEPRHELRPWVPRLNRLLLASFQGNGSGGLTGLNRLSKSQAHRLLLGASCRVGAFWTALALVSVSLQGLGVRRCSEPRAPGRLPSMWL